MPNKKKNAGSSQAKGSKGSGNKKTTAYKIGEKIEKFGDKLAKTKGFAKAGEVIHNLGDKIEHLQDKGSAKQSA